MRTSATLPRLQLGEALPTVPTDRRSRVSLVYLDEDGEPIFHVDPLSGRPVTVVLSWRVTSAGTLLAGQLPSVEARRWILDPVCWDRLEDLRRCGFKVGAADLILHPLGEDTLRPVPTWHLLPDLLSMDTSAIVDRGIAELRRLLERPDNRPIDTDQAR